MYITVLWQLVLGALLVSAANPTPTRRNDDTETPSTFVTTNSDGQFVVNGSAFNFVGTNAYWLHALNTADDIDNTLASIRAAGIRVVRTWAFNDVDTVPENGTWFQLISNGVTSINNGTNGLQKLDKVVELAEKHGIYLMMSLTNNWNPLPLLDNSTSGVFSRDVTNGTNNTHPRNTLSNDYGGMDVYVRQFGSGGLHQHDQFFVNNTIINAFENYTTQIVSRYVNSPAIFGWEIANDPRCNSSLPATPACNTNTITNWHSIIAQHIKSVDPRHLVSSGNKGYFCLDCVKLFPRTTTVAPPGPSAAAAHRRRSWLKPLTRDTLIQERKALQKKARELRKRTNPNEGGMRIRGGWVATPTRRQDDVGVGPAFDGSQGVDSEDIINIPQIGFGSFQLFPDQNSYGPDDPTLPAFNNTVQIGLNWIQRHAEMGQIFGKPVSLTGFGLVTQNNSQAYTPFNTSVAPFGSDQTTGTSAVQQQPFGVTDGQRDDAYAQWLQAGLLGGLQGMIQYQWAQQNLTTQPGTTVSPSTTETGESPDQTTTGISPNDGYSIQGEGEQTVVQTIQQAAQQFGPDE